MKKIILSTAVLFTAFTSFAQPRVLYYLDYSVGTDQMTNALTAAGCIVTYVTDNATFQTDIATPANYDLAIYFSQDYAADATSVTALANFMAISGKKGMYFDYAGDNTNGAMMGVSYTGNTNQTTVSVSDATLSAGIPSNPFTLTNTGWGVFSGGMNALSGSTVSATFTPSGEASIITSLGGNMIVFGFCGDVGGSQEMYVNAINELVPATPSITTSTAITSPLCAGVAVNVDFTAAGVFTAGNVFTAELSDASGSFASPTSIGTLTGTSSGTIAAFIPMSTTGTAYRIRVTSSTPVVTGSDNGTDLLIGAPTVMTSSTPIACHGGTSTITVSGSGGTAPYTGTGTFTQPAGTYAYHILDANGCSSDTSNLNITEPAAIDVSITTAGITITANDASATYQWIDCGTSTPVAGATSQSYTATANGNYAVIVTEGSCKDTSACQAITTVGIHEWNNDDHIVVYPNPSSGAFSIRMTSAPTGMLYIYITDIQGQQVLRLSEAVQGNINKQIDLQNLAKGLYYLQVTVGNIQKTEKLVIE